MTQSQAKELLKVIENWCFQYYDGRRCEDMPENEYGIRIFELLPKYKKNFPKNCFYTGPVYRKMEKGSNCPKELVACSFEKGANAKIGFFSLHHPRYYQSTCINGYDLYNIVLYLINFFSLQEPRHYLTGIKLSERIKNEAEIICYMEQKNFRKEQKDVV